MQKLPPHPTLEHVLAGLCMLALLFGTLPARAQTAPGTLGGGGNHTVVLSADGQLNSWGANANNQLGTGTATGRSSPGPVGTASTWAMVAAGYRHTLAVRADGTLWAWGYNGNGRLGDGTTTDRSTPVQLGFGRGWVQPAASSNGFSAALRTDGSLWAWGSNGNGQLGDGSTIGHSSPAQVGTGTSWKAVWCGGNHALAVRADGTLWAWGSNNNGQLGDGSTTDRSSPVQVGAATNWVAVGAGDNFSLGLRANGTLWAWGDNANGQLGDGSTTDRHAPVQLGGAGWVGVEGGVDHAVALRADGTLWAWGNNANGQLGDGSTTGHSSPAQVGTGTSWVSVAAGDSHTLALQADGTLRAWGLNGNGQLGDGSTTGRTLPTAVPGVAGLPTRSLSAGENYGLAVRPNGALLGWGINGSNQLGDGTTTARNFPIAIGTGTNWVQAAAGDNLHSAGIRADGTLWAWGNNGAGQLGLGNTTSAAVPTQVGSGTTWRQVGCGSFFTVALRADGTLWACGGNADGELGDGTTTSHSSLLQVGSATSWVSVTAGAGHVLALRADGTLWGWGYNGFGQVGDGTGTTRLSPVQVSSATPWASASAGATHNLALKANGSLWAWGNGTYGKIGDGTTNTYLSPIQLGTFTNWRMTSASYAHSAARRADGTLWTWGNNTNGNLGDGSTTASSTPIQEATLGTAWLVVAANSNFTLARGADGSQFFSTGQNTAGQLGDGTTAQSLRFDRPGNSLGQPLPVGLISFVVRRVAPDLVRLDWATASEKNSAYFEVQASADALDWQPLGRVTAAGTATSPRAYEYRDNRPDQPAAPRYYRLRLADVDGTATYSPVRALAPLPAASPTALLPLPNPAHGQVAVVVAVTEALAETTAPLCLLDLTGRELRRSPAGAITLPLDGVPPGLYLLRRGHASARLTVE